MSRGIAARVPGEMFINHQTGTLLSFNRVCLFENCEAIYKIKTEGKESDFIETNNPSSVCNSAILAEFFDIRQNNKLKKFVRYVSSIENRGYNKWTNAQFKRDTGFVRTSGSSANEHLPIKPSDLIGDESERNINDLFETILSNSKRLVDEKKLPSDCQKHIENILSSISQNHNQPVILENGGRYTAAYNKYLGEVLAPISFVTGWCLQPSSSSSMMLSEIDLKNAKIKYYQSLTNKLTDSEIILDDGTQIQISSKANKGAATSISSLNDIIKNLSNNQYKAIRQKYGNSFSLIEKVNDNNQFTGILECAILKKIIDEQEYKQVIMLFDKPMMTLKEYKKNNVILSKNLIRLSSLIGNKSVDELKLEDIENFSPTYRPGFHIIAGIAKKLSQKINENDDFDKMIKEILSHSPVIQINSKISTINNGKDCFFHSFKTVKPSSFNGKVYADSSKNFYMTNIKGKLSFKIMEERQKNTNAN